MGIVTIFEIKHAQVVIGGGKMRGEFDDGSILLDGCWRIAVLLGGFCFREQLLDFGRDFLIPLRSKGGDRRRKKKRT